MNLSEYGALVKAWEIEYGGGKQSRALRYDPTEVTMCCRKCGKLRRKMSRHHTGNDLFFAMMMPHVFAARYIQFLKEDTAKLCDGCHKDAHKLYKPIMKKVWDDLNTHGQRIITKEWCEKWMGILREIFNRWVAKAPRKRKRKRKKSHLGPKPQV